MNFFGASPVVCLTGMLATMELLGLPSQSIACGATNGQAEIVEVTDRLDLKLADGRLLKLAGVDAPFPDFALDRLSTRWTDRPLEVALLASRPDRWGRWLADLATFDGDSLIDDLIRNGSMRVTPELETRNCESQRLAIEKEARRGKLGLWAEPHTILKADNIGELKGADAHLAIIEGRVLKVGQGRSRVYLDFGGREGFTVVVARKSETAFRRQNINLSSLAGHLIRVRGYLENRFAPRIELADPLMIETIEDVSSSGSGG